MKLLYLLSILTFTEAVKRNWVDPHDMNTNAKEKLKRSLSDIDKDTNKSEKDFAATTSQDMSLLYLKRTVSLLLSSASPDKDNPIIYIGSYNYVLDSEEYKFLMTFVGNDKNMKVEDFRKMDTVLSTLFSKTYIKSLFNIRLTKEDMSSIILDTKFLMILGITICLFIFYTLLRNNFSCWYIVSYSITILLIVDYGFRYRCLYEEAEEHNNKLIYSRECDTTIMNWAEYFKFVISNKNCEKKIVTPLEVALNQLKHIIIIPLESVGTGMGGFGKELWERLPFPWNILIFPIMLIFVIIIIFIFLVAFKETSFKINLFHLLQFQFGSDSKTQGISNKTLDKILDATTHRKMIEDTRSSPPRAAQKIKNIKNDSTENDQANENELNSNEIKAIKEEKIKPKAGADEIEKKKITDCTIEHKDKEKNDNK